MAYKQKFPISTTDGGLGVTSTTDKSIIVTNGASAVTFVANTAAEDPLLSVNGAAPAFSSPVPVIGGGTNTASWTTAYTIICGGTTATGTLQEVASVGNNTQVLTSNGAAALPTWQAMGGGSSNYYQVFTSTPATYTPVSGMKYCIVECYGGGGAGGGVITGAINFGGGGGAGGYSMALFDAATIGASQAIALGAAGAGVDANNGGDGGDTTFGALLTAGGGKGGKKGNASSASGGAGGTSSGGTLNIGGENGGIGFYIRLSGKGGTSYWGNGGLGIGDKSSAATTAGNTAYGYGSGGGGAYKGNTAASTAAGGAGTIGIVYIQEYV